MKIFLFLLALIFALIGEPVNYQFVGKYDLNDLEITNFNQVVDFKIINDEVYITDFKGPAVYKFSLNGKLISKTGRSGRGPGEFVYGPRYITSNGEHLYLTSVMPLFSIYDDSLNFIEQRRFIDFASNIQGLHYSAGNLLIVPTQFYEEDLILFNLSDNTRKNIFLDFEIEPGLLSKYDIIKFGDKWLFTWFFQNRFELYDSTFNKESEFRLTGFPEKAEGEYSDYGIIPKEATSYRKKMYEKGTFFPRGTFFNAFTKLSPDLFLIQLGHQTGGSKNALIVDLKGNTKQEITLPVGRAKVLGYYDEVLYFLDRDQGNIVAYNFISKG